MDSLLSFVFLFFCLSLFYKLYFSLSLSLSLYLSIYIYIYIIYFSICSFFHLGNVDSVSNYVSLYGVDLTGRLCMYSWRSAAAFSILWYSEQSDNFDRQVWSTKRICLCGVCWDRCCSECPSFKWIRIAWSPVEGPWI